MTRVSGQVRIGRPVTEVFDVVADERNEPRFNPSLAWVEQLTPGPVGAGTRFRAVLRRGRGTMDIEYTRFERPRLIASRTTMPAATFTGTLTFEEDGSHTVLRWCWDAQPRHAAWLLAPVMAAVGARRERRVWEALRSVLEAHRPDDRHR